MLLPLPFDPEVLGNVERSSLGVGVSMFPGSNTGEGFLELEFGDGVSRRPSKLGDWPEIEGPG
jgi:hypothetical protein